MIPHHTSLPWNILQLQPPGLYATCWELRVQCIQHRHGALEGRQGPNRTVESWMAAMTAMTAMWYGRRKRLWHFSRFWPAITEPWRCKTALKPCKTPFWSAGIIASIIAFLVARTLDPYEFSHIQPFCLPSSLLCQFERQTSNKKSTYECQLLDTFWYYQDTKKRCGVDVGRTQIHIQCHMWMHAEFVWLQVAGLQRAVLGISAVGSMFGCEVSFEAALVAKKW